MSIVSKASKAIVNARNTTAIPETSEFDGFWLNLGVYSGSEESSKFTRIPRGVAVSDLKMRKVYETMDPEFAAQVEVMNEIILAIQEKCLTANDGKPMTEGQSIPVNINEVLYRRQEETEMVRDKETTTTIRNALFS